MKTNQSITPTLTSRPHRGRRLAILASLLLGFSISEAGAASIAVPNFSFEADALADGASTLTISSWTITQSSGSTTGVFNPQNAQYPGSSGSGNLPATGQGQQVAVLNSGGNNGPTLTTAPLTTILANTTYTLTVAFGIRLDFPPPTFGSGHSAYLQMLANGANITDFGFSTDTLPAGSFTDHTVSFTTGSSGPLIGQSLTAAIAYVSDAGGYVDADNVRLDASSVPEPTTTMLLSFSLCFLHKRRRQGR